MATFAAAFKPTNNDGGVFPSAGKSPQGIHATSTTQNYPLGTTIRAVDPVLGEAEFIYCVGVANTAVGDACAITGAFTTARLVAASIGPVGIAMSANVANQYGWYLIKGRGVVTIAADVTADLTAYATATAGTVADDIVAASKIAGMMLEAALDAGGSAIVGTTDTTAAHTAIAFCLYPIKVGAI